MAILGNNSGTGTDTSGFANGRAWATKQLALVAGVASEFHIEYNSGQETISCGVYGPSGASQPGAQLGLAGDVQTLTIGDVHQSILGLSIAFSAGVVWLAAAVQTAFGGHFLETDAGGVSGTYLGVASAKLSGAYPLPDPFPVIDFGPDDRNIRMWLVYTPAVAGDPPVPFPPTIHGRGAA